MKFTTPIVESSTRKYDEQLSVKSVKLEWHYRYKKKKTMVL